MNKADCSTMVDEQPQPLCVAPAEESQDQCLKNQQNDVCRNSMEPDISPRLQNVDNKIGNAISSITRPV